LLFLAISWIAFHQASGESAGGIGLPEVIAAQRHLSPP
jgi:hypothetical protein